MHSIWTGLANALLMAWSVWWALVLGFAISAIVQAWVPRARIERALAGSGPRPIALASALGAASSSCSYAAVAIARSLFVSGASAASALAFQFASTNLVVELGIVIWLLLGWQFALAELIGGALMILIMTLLLRLFISPRLERRAREHARLADPGHQHHPAGGDGPIGERLRSLSAWSDVAHNFRNDWRMVYREISVGLLLAGFVGLLGNHFFASLFLHGAPGPLRLAENVLVGPLIAVLSFVCSVGNIPLAAVLWSGGIGFAGVISFVFADLIVLPIAVIYRKYYGGAFALRALALMFVAIVLAALALEGLFGAAGVIPSARPTRADIFAGMSVDYRLFLNVLATGVFAALFALTIRRGARDPHCGMAVDRRKAVSVRRAGQTDYFCSRGCAEAFAAAHSARAAAPHARAG